MKKAKEKISGIALLTVLTALGKVLGAVHRVPLMAVLGAEGMGYYQSVFPAYALLLTLVSAGISTATARVVALTLREGLDPSSVRRGAMLLALACGVVASVVLLIFSVPISVVQGNPFLKDGYLAIAPAIVPGALVAVVRGYYQGRGNFAPSAKSQLIEQSAKLVAGLGLAYLFKGRGVLAACIGALLGVFLSEVIALAYLIFATTQEKTEKVTTGGLDSGGVVYCMFRVLRGAMPMLLGGVVHPLSHFLDSVLLVNLLSPIAGGVSANAQYGLYSGAVCSLVGLPAILTVALTMSAIPSLAGADAEGCAERLNFSLRISAGVSFLFAALYLGFPQVIVDTLYPLLAPQSRALVVDLLRLSAPAVLASATNQILTAFLQGVGMGSRPVRNSFIGLALRTVVTVLLVPAFGIGTAALASGAGYVLSCVFNAVCWKKHVAGGKIFKNVSRICVPSVIIILLGYFLSPALHGYAVLLGPLAVVLYVVLVFKIGVFDRKECKKMPFSRLLLAIRGGKKGECKDDNGRRTG